MNSTTDFATLADLAARLPQSSVAGRSPVADLQPRKRPADVARCDEASLLAEQAQAGNPQALRPLLEQVRPRALAIAMKVLRNRDDAEDAVQDAMLKVWRNLNRFEGRASFTTWIHRIVMNASLDILRKRSGRQKAPWLTSAATTASPGWSRPTIRLPSARWGSPRCSFW